MLIQVVVLVVSYLIDSLQQAFDLIKSVTISATSWENLF